MEYNDITTLLGKENESLFSHSCDTVEGQDLHLPSPDFMDKVWVFSSRNVPTLRNLAAIFNHGRLQGTGDLSILPVDQGVEHSAGASFAANPMYFDPANIVRLAMEGGCNAVASTLGALAVISRKYAHRIPFIAKLNHNELLTWPNQHQQTLYGSVKEAWNLGAAAVGATIYFGSADAPREIAEVAQLFEEAHNLGMATVLWCYLRNDAFKTKEADYHLAADLTGQANYLGATLRADIIKQKLPVTNEGYIYLNSGNRKYGKTDVRMYTTLASPHPIDLCRYQVLNCYMGSIGLINSGGASTGSADLKAVIASAVINKRAGGMGLIAGRKAFQRPFAEGVALLHSIQDVYLSKEITIA